MPYLNTLTLTLSLFRERDFELVLPLQGEGFWVGIPSVGRGDCRVPLAMAVGGFSMRPVCDRTYSKNKQRGFDFQQFFDIIHYAQEA